MPILSRNVDQKSIETVFSIAICRPTGNKWQSKTLFLSIFDPLATNDKWKHCFYRFLIHVCRMLIKLLITAYPVWLRSLIWKPDKGEYSLRQHLSEQGLKLKTLHTFHIGSFPTRSCYLWHKVTNIFLFIVCSICFGCSKESSHCDGSFEYPQHMSRDMWFPTMWHFEMNRLRQPVQPPFKLRNPKWCSASSIIFIEYSSN